MWSNSNFKLWPILCLAAAGFSFTPPAYGQVIVPAPPPAQPDKQVPAASGPGAQLPQLADTRTNADVQKAGPAIAMPAGFSKVELGMRVEQLVVKRPNVQKFAISGDRTVDVNVPDNMVLEWFKDHPFFDTAMYLIEHKRLRTVLYAGGDWLGERGGIPEPVLQAFRKDLFTTYGKPSFLRVAYLDRVQTKAVAFFWRRGHVLIAALVPMKTSARADHSELRLGTGKDAFAAKSFEYPLLTAQETTNLLAPEIKAIDDMFPAEKGKWAGEIKGDEAHMTVPRRHKPDTWEPRKVTTRRWPPAAKGASPAKPNK